MNFKTIPFCARLSKRFMYATLYICFGNSDIASCFWGWLYKFKVSSTNTHIARVTKHNGDKGSGRSRQVITRIAKMRENYIHFFWYFSATTRNYPTRKYRSLISLYENLQYSPSSTDWLNWIWFFVYNLFLYNCHLLKI